MGNPPPEDSRKSNTWFYGLLAYAVFIIVLVLGSLALKVALSYVDFLLLVLALVTLLSFRFDDLEIVGIMRLRREVRTLKEGQETFISRVENIVQTSLSAKAVAKQSQSQTVNNYVDGESKASIQLLDSLEPGVTPSSPPAPPARSPSTDADIQSMWNLYSQQQYLGAFIVLRNAIERKLRTIPSTKPGEDSSDYPMGKLIANAVRSGVVDPLTADVIRSVNSTANKILHSKGEVSTDEMDQAIRAGLGLLARLDNLLGMRGLPSD